MPADPVTPTRGAGAVGPGGAPLGAPTPATPATRLYLKLAEAKVGRTPAYFTAVMYSAGRWVAEAAKIVDGKVEDRERFLAAIKKASETVEDPRGPIKLDESGNPTQNVYILRVEPVDGKLTDTVLHPYPMG